MLSPYDWNEAIQRRSEYVEERLRDGSPVVGLRYDGGLLLFSLRRTQRKVFEIYDRLMMSAIGNQADIEAVRIASLDFAHQEGFSRSPDDVTVNRLVGFAVSPALKKAFGDAWASPLVFRGVFAELGMTADFDRFAVLSFDGEFAYSEGFAVVGGDRFAEDLMAQRLGDQGDPLPLEEAIRLASEVWAVGRRAVATGQDVDPHMDGDDAPPTEEPPPGDFLREQLDELSPEAGVLERGTDGGAKFRMLEPDRIRPLMAIA